MEFSEELKYLVNKFCCEYPNEEIEKIKKNFKKHKITILIIMPFFSAFLLGFSLIMHFSNTAKDITVDDRVRNIFGEIFFGIFGILWFFLWFFVLFKRLDEEGRWFLKEILGFCKRCKINEKFFIPNKIDTPRQERNPIFWTEVDSIDIEILHKESSNPEWDTYDYYLKMNLKNKFESKLVWILPVLFVKTYFPVVMKKFCEFLIKINQ